MRPLVGTHPPPPLHPHQQRSMAHGAVSHESARLHQQGGLHQQAGHHVRVQVGGGAAVWGGGLGLGLGWFGLAVGLVSAECTMVWVGSWVGEC